MCFCDFWDFSDVCDFCDFLENRSERLSALRVFKNALFSTCKMGGKLISRFWLCTNYVKHMQNTSVFQLQNFDVLGWFWWVRCFCFCDFVISGKSRWALVSTWRFKKTHFFQHTKWLEQLISCFWLCTNYVKHMQNTSVFLSPNCDYFVFRCLRLLRFVFAIFDFLEIAVSACQHCVFKKKRTIFKMQNGWSNWYPGFDFVNIT